MTSSPRAVLGAVLLAVTSCLSFVPAASISPTPRLLSWSEQIRVRESWLVERHRRLLPMMRRHHLDWWIVVNEEFHDDPLTEYVAPPRPYVGRRDLFVFIDTGGGDGPEALRKVAVTGYAEESVGSFFESPDDPRPAAQVLGELYRAHPPERIGLSMGGARGMTRSLTHDAYAFLRKALDRAPEESFVSAAPLIEEYLDTRLPAEMPHFRDLVHLTEILARRALSAEVIAPGVTTVGEVRAWLLDAIWAHGVRTWFQPDVRVQRRGMEPDLSRGFLAVAPEETVIRPGDLVHLDLGLSYMGFDSDWQKMAYVLRPGEEDAPRGLKRALANTVALQDALVESARPDRTVADVYERVMAAMEEAGIEARIYSHPLGNHGHGMGPSIDFRSAAGPGAEGRRLRPGSYMSIELNTRTPVAEWDGREVFVMEEDPAWLTEEGYRFFRPRQEELYLIR